MVERGEAFVREVDEEMRREQLKQLWDRFGIYAVVLLVIILAGIGGYKYRESSRIAASEAAGARFEQALKLIADGKTDDALTTFQAIAKDQPGGYQTLSQFQMANLQVKAGKIPEAVASFEAISKSTIPDQILRDFAALKAAMLRLDTADWTEMENRLTPLLGDKSAWRAMARETLALAAYKADKKDEARKLFEQTLGDRATPQSVSERAMVMLSLLTDAEAAKGAIVTTVLPQVPAKKEPEKDAKAADPAPKKD